MKHIQNIAFSLLFLLILTACNVDRNQADARLVKACEAGVNLFIEDGREVKEIKSVSFSVPDIRSEGDRRVSMLVHEGDGWHGTDKTFSCSFIERLGLMGSYSANIYQIDMGEGRIYGQKDGKIMGSYDEWSRVTDTVDRMLK
jgi:hypothetical protein